MDRQLQHAKALRQSSTEAELRLWYHLRARRFVGVKFKRQKPIGPYIVDFIAVDYGLIVEVDGGQHAMNSYDRQRDAWLVAQGFRVLRFWNNQVMNETTAVLEEIKRVIDFKRPSP